jgi:hypothetical protein
MDVNESMAEETTYECPECGTSVGEHETRCPGCGAVFEDSTAEDDQEREVAVVAAEKDDEEGGEPEGKAEEAEDDADETAREPENAEEEENEPVKEAEKIEDAGDEPVEEAEKVEAGEITGEKAEAEKEDAGEASSEREEEPAARMPKKAGLNMGGIVIAALGGAGILGALLLDPLMNLVDSKHPADINIGPTQLLGVVVAALVLAAGGVIAFVMRKKGK